MIQEDYVSFEIALILKNKNFCIPTNAYYDGEGNMSITPNAYIIKDYNEQHNFILCPTLQMAMKWLREVHKLAINVEFQIDCPTWKWRIYHIELLKGRYTNFKHYDTYEETCIEAIKYALENLI